MTVTHPVALRDGRSHPGGYTFRGETYPIDSDGVIDCPTGLEDEIRAALSEHYDTDLSELDGDGDGTEPGDAVCTCDPGDACDTCGGTCPTVKDDGEVCGRERPCRYHDEEE